MEFLLESRAKVLFVLLQIAKDRLQSSEDGIDSLELNIVLTVVAFEFIFRLEGHDVGAGLGS